MFRRLRTILRVALAVLAAVAFLLALRSVVAFELALPEARLAAFEAAGFEADPEVLYSRSRDSLGVRLAARAALETGSPEAIRLDAEIAEWQERLVPIVWYRDLAAADRLRLYGWTAVALLAGLFVALVFGPRVVRRLRRG